MKNPLSNGALALMNAGLNKEEEGAGYCQSRNKEPNRSEKATGEGGEGFVAITNGSNREGRKVKGINPRQVFNKVQEKSANTNTEDKDQEG